MSGWRINWVDYYAVLDIDREASFDTIKKKYRKLVAKYHPDVYHGEDAHDKTAQINDAYDVLSNKEEKKAYDAVWDARKNGTYNENQNSNTTSENQNNVNYEDIKNNYTAEEKRYAKQLALKEITNEELQKVEIIINSKNEIIFNAYQGNIDKREYYNMVKDLVSIGFNFINDLNNLAKEAYKYDLLEEEELINQTISYLEQELKGIPKTPKDAGIYTKEIEYKESVRLKISEELANCDEVIYKLRSILIYSYERQISHLEYKSVLQNVVLESNEVASRLRQLAKIAGTLNLEEECKQLLEMLTNLDGMLLIMPDTYEKAVKAGQIEKLKEELKPCLALWGENKNKVKKISKILSKHPNSKRYVVLYNYAESILDDYLEQLSLMKNEVSSVKNEREANEKMAKDMSNKAIKIYKDAEVLHKKANDIFENTQTYQGTKNEIEILSKSAYSSWDKGQALELLLEAKEVVDTLGYVNGNDQEFEKLFKFMKKIIKEVSKVKYEFESENDISMINPYINFNLLDYEMRLNELDIEIKQTIFMSALSFLFGASTGIGTLGLLFQENKSKGQIIFMIILALLSVGGIYTSSDVFNTVKLLKAEKEEVEEKKNEYILKMKANKKSKSM